MVIVWARGKHKPISIFFSLHQTNNIKTMKKKTFPHPPLFLLRWMSMGSHIDKIRFVKRKDIDLIFKADQNRIQLSFLGPMDRNGHVSSRWFVNFARCRNEFVESEIDNIRPPKFKDIFDWAKRSNNETCLLLLSRVFIWWIVAVQYENYSIVWNWNWCNRKVIWLNTQQKSVDSWLNFDRKSHYP